MTGLETAIMGIGVADLARVLGLLGAAIYLTSYVAIQAGRLCGNGRAYVTWNTLAAALVLLSLTVDFNPSAAAIQTTWLVLGGLRLAGFLQPTRARSRAARNPLARRTGYSLLPRRSS